MSTNVTMSYGSYSFDPVPSISYSRAAERTPGKDFCLASPIQVTLQGILRPSDGSGGFGGFQNIIEGIQDLQDAFKCGSSCQTFLVRCNGQAPWFSGDARVTNIDISPRSQADLYIQTAQYSITLEMISTTGTVYDNGPAGISAISEEWNMEFLDERTGGTASTPGGGSVSIAEAYTIGHNVTITAPYTCASGDGLNIAEAYLLSNFSSKSPSGAYINGILAPSTNFYNHFRTINKSVYEGTVTMNETWVASDTGALEDFTVEIQRGIDTEITTVTVNGTIQGLASSASYPGASFTPKLSNATSYWSSTVQPNLYSRANAIYSGTRTLKTNPVNYSYGYNTVAGTITYNYTYDNRPNSVISDNSRAETINITHNDPPDIFTSLTVLGRTQGPLHQEINTVGPRTRDISIEAIMATSDTISLTPPTDYDSYVASYESSLSSTYDQVFVNSETKTWSPKDGRFTYNKSWTVGSCS